MPGQPPLKKRKGLIPGRVSSRLLNVFEYFMPHHQEKSDNGKIA
jgi:hypothetical protein